MSPRVNRRSTLKGLAALTCVPLLPRFAFANEDPHMPGVPLADALRADSFDDGWRFHRGDVPAAESPTLPDGDWREIILPHDWSIEDLSAHRESTGEAAIWNDCNCAEEIGPFSRIASEGEAATGWVVGGVGWYRKTFASPKVPANGRAQLLFDGAYMNADVWINGHHLGNHPYGYTGFAFDLAPFFKKDGNNVLAVKINNFGKNSRWYSGSGIYRHVWLTVMPQIYLPLWGIHVQTPDVATDAATLKASIQVGNNGPTSAEAHVLLKILDASGNLVAQADVRQQIPASGKGEVILAAKLTQPKLWSPSSPHLYSAQVEVQSLDGAVDKRSVNFGVRRIQVDAEHGLRINGESFKLRGGCMHHDNGILGSAAIDRAEERRVELMKANGFNAIRCSHNPQSPAFLDACDRLGMMVVDEAFDMWSLPKNTDDYHLYFKDWWQRDIDAMVLRDRNHPSVILWSVGNEIPERADPAGLAIEKRLIERVMELDPSRPITEAIPPFFDAAHPRPWADTDAPFKLLGVGGYNYEWSKYESDHARHPERVMAGTESFPLQVFEIWEKVNKLPYVIGDFVWTGMDYLGESALGGAVLDAPKNPFQPPPPASGAKPPAIDMDMPANTTFKKPCFPWFDSYCGDIDIVGNKKPQSYFRDVVWGRSKLEVAVLRPVPEGRKEELMLWGWWDELRSWTWPGHEGKALTVRIYSTADQVRLELNGKAVGTADVSSSTKLTAELQVRYAPGELKAIAIKDGNVLSTMLLKTVGAPHRITLHPDRTQLRRDRNDLSYVMVHVEDSEGTLIPDAVMKVHFKVAGAGQLAAVGNANPKEMDSFRLARHKTFGGMCLAILRPTGAEGAIQLEASAEGLQSASTEIKVG